MHEKLEVVTQILNGFDYQEYFTADTSRKLSLILAAENFILGVETVSYTHLDVYKRQS